MRLIGLQPCTSSKGWDSMVLRVPSNPIHSVIPDALTKRFGIKGVGLFVVFCWNAEHQSHWVCHGADNAGRALLEAAQAAASRWQDSSGMCGLCNLGTMCSAGQILCRLLVVLA